MALRVHFRMSLIWDLSDVFLTVFVRKTLRLSVILTSHIELMNYKAWQEHLTDFCNTAGSSVAAENLPWASTYILIS